MNFQLRIQLSSFLASIV